MHHAALAFALFFLPLSQEPEILHSGTGPHKRPVVIAEGKARQFFDQGLNFLYAFNHGEAKRSFRTAAKYDPDSAMAWWGIAMANSPHINSMGVSPQEEQEAHEALQKAMLQIERARAVDQALIRAAVTRFQHPQPADRNPLNVAYAEAMEKVWKEFPNDADVGALYAESRMNLRPWDLWTADGKPHPGTDEIVETLEKTLEVDPNHPFALHLYIHAVEASDRPERARDAADRLRVLQPGLGHNVHMPSHIDVRVGDWQKAIVSNQKAIEADRAYREKRPNQTIYRLYMAHNHHMLAFAAMMVGQSELAIRELDGLIASIPPESARFMAGILDGFFASPLEARVRFGRWDEVLAHPEPAEYLPISRALWRHARAVAHAAKGDPARARQEFSLFLEARKLVPESAGFGNNTAAAILEVAHHLTEGEVLVAEGKQEEAIAALERAVRAEDALRYDEPPDWIQPTRHTLGALLAKLGRHEQAVAVYREDLRRLPNNGWSLYGLASSLDALGKKEEAEKARARFREVWAKADVSITSSCLCIPGKGG
jgi:tetratricopeptide (TPR) repeat protein